MPKAIPWKTRLCDLELDLDGSLYAKAIRALHEELDRVGIALRPHFYLSTEYGTVIRTANIALLWTDGIAWGRRLARTHGLRVRTPEELLITLRHETGHALSYVHGIYRSLLYRRLFKVRGSFFGTYPDQGWRPRARHEDSFRRGEVIKIYAARHPDEDFAICFQTWLRSEAEARRRKRGAESAGWRREFADRPVLMEKLGFVAAAAAAYGPRPAVWNRGDLDEPLGAVEYTVEEWLQRVKEIGSYNLLPSHPVA